jgi:ABC-2 type transport system permease protein
LLSVAGRALRAVPREPEALIPALIVPIFFFAMNVGSLTDISSFAGVDDFEAFQLPVATVFAVTGISRASALVTDIQSGYFDRLFVSPVDRYSLLLGLMAADLVLVMALCVPVLALGFILGVGFATGPVGVLAFLILSRLWGLAFTGFPYAIALCTGNPGAVNSSFILFFPFAFLTTTFLPQEALTSWLAAVADYNPVMYLLAGLRALISDGWVLADLLPAVGAVALVALVSFYWPSAPCARGSAAPREPGLSGIQERASWWSYDRQRLGGRPEPPTPRQPCAPWWACTANIGRPPLAARPRENPRGGLPPAPGRQLPGAQAARNARLQTPPPARGRSPRVSRRTRTAVGPERAPEILRHLRRALRRAA